MKSPMLFLREILQDLGDWCCTSTTFDLKTIESRFEHEGWSFLTITLPNFGKDLEKALDQGFVSDDLFAGFQRSGGLPRFLSGFLRLVFESGSGRLLDEPDVMAIHSLRQLTLMFGKVLLPCSNARTKAAYAQYIETEKEVKRADAELTEELASRFARMSTLLWGQLLSDVDLKVYNGEVIPQHGPGATADKLRGNSKWMQTEWTQRLEEEFPSSELLIPSQRHRDALASLKFLSPAHERPVKVIDVPKTLKTPRIIAVEPTCMMFVQKGLYRLIYEAVEANDFASATIGWSSSVRNHELAAVGSENGTFATLDLSEASDRVSNQHVRLLLRNHPHLFRAVDACRSRKADVLGHGEIRLAKFASMGSALTFPMEALVFSTVVFMGIESELNHPMSRKDLESFRDSVRIYGDDIIVPTRFVHSVNRHLEAFGFKVNRHKSFWTGKFRESCGREFYNGADVSIVRVRSVFPTDRLQHREVIKTIALRNHLYASGLWKATRYLDDMIEGLKIPFPRVLDTSPVLGRHSFLGYDVEKQCPILHRPLVKGIVESARLPASELDDVWALNKVLSLAELRLSLTSEALPASDVEHLHVAGRPRSVGTKTRWSVPF